MTREYREYAKSRIEYLLKISRLDERDKEALEAAIQALSQEPCDDVISRILKRMWNCRGKHTTSIGILKRMWNCRGKHTTSIDKVAMEQIIRDELPSVTQKCEKCAMNGSGSKYCDNCGQKSGKWIPVSEGPPKSSGVYIVSRWFSDGEESAILTDANYYDGNGDWYNDNRINWGRDLVTDKIVAWMPLPEPYEPQEREIRNE